MALRGNLPTSSSSNFPLNRLGSGIRIPPSLPMLPTPGLPALPSMGLPSLPLATPIPSLPGMPRLPTKPASTQKTTATATTGNGSGSGDGAPLSPSIRVPMPTIPVTSAPVAILPIATSQYKVDSSTTPRRESKPISPVRSLPPPGVDIPSLPSLGSAEVKGELHATSVSVQSPPLSPSLPVTSMTFGGIQSPPPPLPLQMSVTNGASIQSPPPLKLGESALQPKLEDLHTATTATNGSSGSEGPYRSPGIIKQRVEVAPTSSRRGPIVPAVPLVNVRPISTILPASPISRPASLPISPPVAVVLPASTEVVAPQGPGPMASIAVTPPGVNPEQVQHVANQPMAPPVANPAAQYGPAAMPIRPARPDYANMSAAQQADMRIIFRSKFHTLRENFPGWSIIDPPASFSLDQIHDMYEGYVKQIVVSLNCNQWKVYLIIMFLAIEVFCIRILGLDARGFTMAQLRIMTRYDQVLVELGEKYYVQGPSSWPVEARILMMAGFNGIIFIAVKYLSKWVGGDAMAGPLQEVITNFLGGGNLFTTSTTSRDQFGIPIPPGGGAPPPGGTQTQTQSQAPPNGGTPAPGNNAQPNAPQQANPLGALAGAFSGMMGGNGNQQMDIPSMLAGLGNLLTANMPMGGTQANAGTTNSSTNGGTSTNRSRPTSAAPTRPVRF